MDHRSTSTHAYYLHGAALPVKDVLRGVRHGLRSIRNTAVSLQSKLPGPLGALGASTIGHVDRFVAKVDQNSSLVAHRYLDPEVARNGGTAAFAQLITRPDAAVLFAKIAYDNLKLVISYICEDLDRNDRYFISETLAAIAYQRAAGGFAARTDEIEKAALVLEAMLRVGVVRTSTSTSAAHSADDTVRQPAVTACFAVMLWLLVERDHGPEDEEPLLLACCDLAMVLREEIAAAGEDAETLADLLKTHVDMV